MFADLREWCLSFYTFRTGAGPPGDRWKCPIPLPGHDPACVGTWFRRGTYICDARGASQSRQDQYGLAEKDQQEDGDRLSASTTSRARVRF